MKKEKFFSEETRDYLAQQAFINIDDEDNVAIFLKVFYDQRHSWMQVPLILLAMLGITPDRFTKFSRIDKKNGLIYLEEDLDVGTFLDVLKEVPTPENSFMDILNVRPVSHGEVSEIRDLPHNDKGSSIH